MSILRPIYNRPRLVALAIGLILVAGLAAITTLPRQEDPIPRERYARIVTFFPGASAARVEALITDRVEDAILEVPEILELQSVSRTGVSVINIELQESVYQTDEVWSRVRNKITDIEGHLPAGVGKPELDVEKLPAVTMLVGLTGADGAEVPLGVVHRLAKDLETLLRNIPGTEDTEIYGEPEEEFLVAVDPVRLAGAGLTISDISAALSLADTKAPSGQLRSSETSLIVEVGGELTSLDRIREVPVATSPDGRVMRIGDLADVSKTERLPAATAAFLDGRRGVAIAAIMQEGQRIDVWSDDARAAIMAFEATLPAPIILETLIDQSVYTQGRLVELAQNFFLGIVLVIAILYVVMGWRSAILVGVSLPLSVAMVLAAFKFLGIPMHQMSITGLIIALGLLIDNAIVVIDEYKMNRTRGMAIRSAAETAVKHLQVPLFASTLTTALTFAPIYLMPGGAGDFVGAMALAVILAIFASLALSLTLVPALAGYADERRDTTAHYARAGYRNDKLLAAYRRSLDTVLARPQWGIGLSLVLPLLGFLLAGQLVEQFFPPVERNQFQIQVALPPTAPIAETEATIARINAILDRYPDITRRHWFLGEGAPKAFYNVILSRDGVPSFAAAIVDTTSADATSEILPGLQTELIRAVPNAEVLALPFEQGPPVSAPIELRIVGPDLDALRALGEEARAILAQTDNITYTRAQISGGRPKLMLVPDEDAARIAGFRLTDISSAIAAGLEGAEGGSVLEKTEELPVRVRLNGGDRSDVERLTNRPMVSAGARQSASGETSLPLSALTRLDLVPEDEIIARRNRERVNIIQGFIVPFSLPSVALGDFQERLAAANIAVPPGYRLEFGGESAERDEAVGQLLSSVGILMVMMVGTIILTFNSVRLAGVIAAVAAMSVGLAFLSLWLFNQPRGFMAIVGAMGLIGLAINGAIVVLTNLRTNEKARRADPAAIRDTVIDSTRHIIGTTLTTIAGFLPLILWADSFWQPLSLAIAGGVIGSAVLALYFTPTMFILIARAKNAKSADIMRMLPDREIEDIRPAAE